MQDSTEGSLNAYKTLYLGAGATAEVVGSDFHRSTSRSRRARAKRGSPPLPACRRSSSDSPKGWSATYSNYGQARRRFADLTMRPLWRTWLAP